MNIREADIETAFIEYLKAEKEYEILGRQVDLPFGRLDVLAFSKNENQNYPMVFEIKKGKITEDACTQLFGYMGQIDSILLFNQIIRTNETSYLPKCFGVLVGTEINDRVQRVIDSMRVSFCRYYLHNEKIIFDWNRFQEIETEKRLHKDHSREINLLKKLALESFYSKKKSRFHGKMKSFIQNDN